ncbi:hypothetical protein Droror1_Dr00021225 [Drosera rotundifolia]
MVNENLNKEMLFKNQSGNENLALIPCKGTLKIDRFGYYSMRAVHGASVEPVVNEKRGDGEEGSHDWKVKMLNDGDCPLSMREVRARVSS